MLCAKPEKPYVIISGTSTTTAVGAVKVDEFPMSVS
jgi:hypothetical protein